MSLTTGYTEEGNLAVAMKLFEELRKRTTHVDGFMVSGIIAVFADFALLELGVASNWAAGKYFSTHKVPLTGPDAYLATCPTASLEHHFIAPDGKELSCWKCHEGNAHRVRGSRGESSSYITSLWLVPGHMITEKDPDLLKAAEKTLYQSGTRLLENQGLQGIHQDFSILQTT